MLDVEELSSGYGNAVVIRDISFSIRKGGVLAIIGPNGAGKSTLLWTLSGLLRARIGKIIYNSHDITNWKCSRIAAVGIRHVLQGAQVFHRLTVEDNMMLGIFRVRAEDPGLSKQRRMIYDSFPVLEKKQNHLAGSLSGGERQMLAISAALISAPECLLLDEPSAGLAPLLVRNLFEILANLRRSMSLTTLLVEQNAEVALRFADRGLVMAQGTAVIEAEAKGLIANQEIKQIYLGIKGART
jgi:branched-chain amino acid transport system ATP-binding protein